MGCWDPADYATANTEHHLEWCSLKNLIKGKGRQEGFSGSEDVALPTKPILVLVPSVLKSSREGINLMKPLWQQESHNRNLFLFCGWFLHFWNSSLILRAKYHSSLGRVIKPSSSAESFSHQKSSQHHAECLKMLVLQLADKSPQHLLKRTLPKDGKFPGSLSSSASCLQHCSAAFLPCLGSLLSTTWLADTKTSLLLFSEHTRWFCVHRRYQNKETTAQKAWKQLTIYWEAEEGSLLEKYLSVLFAVRLKVWEKTLEAFYLLLFGK